MRNLDINIKLLIISFIISNLILVFLVFNNKIEKTLILNELKENKAKFYDVTSKGRLLNSTSHMYREIYADTNYIKKRSKLAIIAIFDDYGCPICIRQTVERLNDFNRDYPNIIKAFYIGANTKFKEIFNCNFEIENIPNIESIFNSQFEFSLPSIFLLDKNNLILMVYSAEAKNYSKQNVFFKKLNYLISNIK